MMQFLQDRVKAVDYNGSLSYSILEFLLRCKNLTDGNLDRTSITKILVRFSKKGDEKIKTLAKKIADNGITASRKRNEVTKSGANNGVSKDSKRALETTPAAPSTVAGVKRPRSNDTNNSQPSKRIASSQGTGSPVQAKSPDSTKRPPTTGALSKVGSNATSSQPVKQKQVATKPLPFYSNLLSAAKKTGTSNAELAAAAAQAKGLSQANAAEKKPAVPSGDKKPPMRVADKKPGTAASSSQSKPAFSFAATLANLTSPQESEPSAKPEVSAPLETDDERARRIRKEQRRKLKVHFKPDDSLTKVRLFHHDPDEELGHNASQVRDVGDIDSEGRMFKMRQSNQDDMMDIDEDDETSPLDDLNRPINQPSLVDFSTIDAADREINYLPYGGGLKQPESPDKVIQEQRETITLGAFYTRSVDIPPSPREPPEETTESTVPTKNFGPLPENIAEILASFKEMEDHPMSDGQPPNSTSELAALMSSYQPQQNSAQQPATELEKIFAQFAAPQQQTQQQQTFNPFASQQAQPNQYQDPTAVHGAMQASHMPQMASQHGQPAMGGNVIPDLNLNSVLASLQNPTQQVAPLDQMQFQKDMQLLQTMMSQGTMPPGFPTMGDGQQQGGGVAPMEIEERRRWREQGAGDDSDDVNGFKQHQNWQKRKPGMTKEPPKFVVQCKYYKAGKCIKASACTYRHDD